MGAFFGCWIICAVLIWGFAVGHNKLDEIVKAIKNHSPQIFTGSEFCEQNLEKDLNDFSSCDNVPS